MKNKKEKEPAILPLQSDLRNIIFLKNYEQEIQISSLSDDVPRLIAYAFAVLKRLGENQTKNNFNKNSIS